MDKLTIGEVECWIDYWQHPGFENQYQVAKQLADTMREKEKLIGHITLAIENMNSEDFSYARHTLEEALSNKDTYDKA